MRLRFTIRDLLWLTVAVALAVGLRNEHIRLTDDTVSKVKAIEIEHQHVREAWWREVSRLQNQIMDLRAQLQQISAVGNGPPIDDMPILRPRNRKAYADQEPPPAEPFIVRPFGEKNDHQSP